MREIGLYYPFFHVRDDSWLKAAALYLPQIARVRPPGYPLRDSATAGFLRNELDFLQDLDPGPQVTAVAGEFEVLMNQEERRALERFSFFMSETWDPDYAWIHASQLGVPAHGDLLEWERATTRYIGQPSSNPVLRFILRMRDLGLIDGPPGDFRINPITGQRDDGHGWVRMHRSLVSIYSCALAARIAQANSLTPVSDDPQFFALSDLWTADDIGAALLRDTPPEYPPPASDRAAVLYACMAVRTVIPANIEHVPVEKIVRARKALCDEFDAFSAHIEALGEEFALLDGIEDPGILRARLESMVERDLAKPARELERGLRALGMDPVRAVFGLKSLELPAVAALAAHALHLSPIAGAGGAIAVQLLSSTRTARRAATEQRNSAAGYLLGLRRELDPVGTLTRARRALFGRP
ncbi:DUF6236 family protein [Streptomyces sp. NPDC001665]